jgi:hypothetical protein
LKGLVAVGRRIEFTEALPSARDENGVCGKCEGVKAAEMTEALVQINDQLARASRAFGFDAAVFHCECGDCLAEDVRLPLEEHDEIRAREDLIFAPGHSVR